MRGNVPARPLTGGWAADVWRRRPNELASYQEKVFRIDNHVGVGISGLTADAGLLMKWMRTECLNHRFVYESPLETSRMVIDIADSTQPPSLCPAARAPDADHPLATRNSQSTRSAHSPTCGGRTAWAS